MMSSVQMIALGMNILSQSNSKHGSESIQRAKIFSLQTMYFSFIRPCVEYVDIVCNNCKQYESNDPIQNQTARRVTGATKLASINYLPT